MSTKYKEWQRVDIKQGRFLLRHTEHYENIQKIIEEEYPTWTPMSVSGMTTAIPGGDEYIIFFHRNEQIDD